MSKRNDNGVANIANNSKRITILIGAATLIITVLAALLILTPIVRYAELSGAISESFEPRLQETQYYLPNGKLGSCSEAMKDFFSEVEAARQNDDSAICSRMYVAKYGDGTDAETNAIIVYSLPESMETATLVIDGQKFLVSGDGIVRLDSAYADDPFAEDSLDIDLENPYNHDWSSWLSTLREDVVSWCIWECEPKELEAKESASTLAEHPFAESENIGAHSFSYRLPKDMTNMAMYGREFYTKTDARNGREYTVQIIRHGSVSDMQVEALKASIDATPGWFIQYAQSIHLYDEDSWTKEHESSDHVDSTAGYAQEKYIEIRVAASNGLSPSIIMHECMHNADFASGWTETREMRDIFAEEKYGFGDQQFDWDSLEGNYMTDNVKEFLATGAEHWYYQYDKMRSWCPRLCAWFDETLGEQNVKITAGDGESYGLDAEPEKEKKKLYINIITD